MILMTATLTVDDNNDFDDSDIDGGDDAVAKKHLIRNNFNPLKCSGVSRLHFEEFSAIQV